MRGELESEILRQEVAATIAKSVRLIAVSQELIETSKAIIHSQKSALIREGLNQKSSGYFPVVQTGNGYIIGGQRR